MKALVATNSERAAHMLGADARDAANEGELTAQDLAEIDAKFARTAAQTIAQTNAASRAVMHHITQESTGCGMDDKKRKVCSCGWKGPWRFEYSDSMCSDLRSDERGHRGVL